MKRMVLARKSVLLAILLLSNAPGSVTAESIIGRHDRPDALYRELGEAFRPYVVQLGLPDESGTPRLYGGMGTMIGANWVLTAGHVADRFTPGSAFPVDVASHYVWIMGRGYRVKAVHLHPQYRRYEAEHDIALLELERSPTNVRIACLQEGANELGREVINVGAGLSGDGVRGAGKPDGAMRAGTAIVYRTQQTTLLWRFRAPDQDAPDLHGISGPGDSGGPALMVEGDRVCVAGVSGSQRRPRGHAPATYGVEEVYARVSAFRPWILSVMANAPP